MSYFTSSPMAAKTIGIRSKTTITTMVHCQRIPHLLEILARDGVRQTSVVESMRKETLQMMTMFGRMRPSTALPRPHLSRAREPIIVCFRTKFQVCFGASSNQTQIGIAPWRLVMVSTGAAAQTGDCPRKRSSWKPITTAFSVPLHRTG